MSKPATAMAALAVTIGGLLGTALAQGPFASIEMNVVCEPDGNFLRVITEVVDAGDADAPAPNITEKRIILQEHIPGGGGFDNLVTLATISNPDFSDPEVDNFDLSGVAFSDDANSLRIEVQLDVPNSNKGVYVSRCESFEPPVVCPCGYTATALADRFDGRDPLVCVGTTTSLGTEIFKLGTTTRPTETVFSDSGRRTKPPGCGEIVNGLVDYQEITAEQFGVCKAAILDAVSILVAAGNSVEERGDLGCGL